METIINTQKQHILVLTDLKKNSLNVLKSAASMAQLVNADIEIFHVKKAVEFTENSNQVAAIRAIAQAENKTLGMLRDMAATISKNHGVNTSFSYAFGNVKNEIRSRIAKRTPEMVVVGKKAGITPSFLGDRMVSFILKNFNGTVLVADNNNVINADQFLSLGLLGAANIDTTNPVGATIFKHAQAPVKSFSTATKNTTVKNAIPSTSDIVNFVFDQTNDVVNNIISYVSKSRVNLIYVADSDNIGMKQANFNKIINQVDASLLVNRN